MIFDFLKFFKNFFEKSVFGLQKTALDRIPQNWRTALKGECCTWLLQIAYVKEKKHLLYKTYFLRVLDHRAKYEQYSDNSIESRVANVVIVHDDLLTQ